MQMYPCPSIDQTDQFVRLYQIAISLIVRKQLLRKWSAQIGDSTMTKVVESGVIWGSRSQYVTDGPKPVRGDGLPCRFARFVLIYFLGTCVSDRCKNESKVACVRNRFIVDLFNLWVYGCLVVSWGSSVIAGNILDENKVNQDANYRHHGPIYLSRFYDLGVN